MHIYATIFSTSTNFGGDFGGDFSGVFCLFTLFAEKFFFLISCCFYEIYAAKQLKRFRRSENLPGSVKASGFLCIIFFRAAARNFQSGIIGYNWIILPQSTVGIVKLYPEFHCAFFIEIFGRLIGKSRARINIVFLSEVDIKLRVCRLRAIHRKRLSPVLRIGWICIFQTFIIFSSELLRRFPSFFLP